MILWDNKECRVDLVSAFARRNPCGPCELLLDYIKQLTMVMDMPILYFFQDSGDHGLTDDGTALFPAFSHMPKDYNTMTALFQYLGENADSLKAHLLIISQQRKKKREHMVSLENTIENTSTLSVSCLNNKLFNLTVNFSGTLIVCFHLSPLLATLSFTLSFLSSS